MPATPGGRLGWNDPPPAAITITFASNTLPWSVRTRNSGSPIFSTDSIISPRWKVAPNGLICAINASVSPAPVMKGDCRNVVDRFLRIELGALAANFVENIDEVRLHIEQAKLEHGEQPARTGANNQHIGLDRFTFTQHRQNPRFVRLRFGRQICQSSGRVYRRPPAIAIVNMGRSRQRSSPLAPDRRRKCPTRAASWRRAPSARSAKVGTGLAFDRLLKS